MPRHPLLPPPRVSGVSQVLPRCQPHPEYCVCWDLPGFIMKFKGYLRSHHGWAPTVETGALSCPSPGAFSHSTPTKINHLPHPASRENLQNLVP